MQRIWVLIQNSKCLIGSGLIKTINPYDVKGARQTVKEALAFSGPSVIISIVPCVLLKTRSVPGKPLRVDALKCTGCKVCLSLGCPALEFKDEKAHINEVCVGCNVCADLCSVEAIGGEK